VKIFIKNNFNYLKLFLVVIFWGSAFIAGKILAEKLPPFTSSFLRFLVASFFLVLFSLNLYGKLPKINLHQIILIIFLAVTGIVGYNFFFFSGLKFIAASRASMIMALNPSFIAILSTLIFKEKFNKFKFTGIILSLIGAFTVISKGNFRTIFQGNIGRGELLILGCVVCWGFFTLAGKITMKDLKPIIVITYACLVGTIILIIPAILEAKLQNFRQYNFKEWVSIFVLGFFGTVLGFVWFYEGIDKIGPSQAGIFMNFVPVFATIFAILILGEKLVSSLIIGAVFIISGVYLTNYQAEKFSPKAGFSQPFVEYNKNNT